MTKFILEQDIEGCADCKLKYWAPCRGDPYYNAFEYAYRCIATGEILFYEGPASTYMSERCPLKKKEGVAE